MADLTGNLGEALHDNGDGTFSLSTFVRGQGTLTGQTVTANQGNPNAGGPANAWPVQGVAGGQALPVSSAKASAVVLNQASANQAASGNTANLTVGQYGELAVDVNVTAFTGGTAPTIAFALDRLGADGIWYTIYTGTALSAAGAQSTSVGVGATVPAAFGSTVRLRWTFGGTVAPTGVTFSASIIGK